MGKEAGTDAAEVLETRVLCISGPFLQQKVSDEYFPMGSRRGLPEDSQVDASAPYRHPPDGPPEVLVTRVFVHRARHLAAKGEIRVLRSRSHATRAGLRALRGLLADKREGPPLGENGGMRSVLEGGELQTHSLRFPDVSSAHDVAHEGHGVPGEVENLPIALYVQA